MVRTALKWFGVLILVMFIANNPQDAANLIGSVIDAAKGISDGLGTVAAKIG